MAKIAFEATAQTRGVNFADVKPNAKRNIRYYTGKNGEPKFATVPADKTTFPAGTKGVYQLEAHVTANNRIIWPTKSIAEFRADLVKDKHFTSKEVENVMPGKFGNFWYNAGTK